jgi:integrase
VKRRYSGEGSVYKRKNGRWVGTLRVTDQNGIADRLYFYGTTQAEVRKQLEDAQAARRKGMPLITTSPKLEPYLNSWLDDIVRVNNRPSTYRSYEQELRCHVIPALGEIELHKLSVQQLRSFMTQLLDSGLSARSVQYIHAIVRKALADAVRDELIARNVALLAKPPRVIQKEVSPLCPEEARNFLGGIAGNRMEALFIVALSLGLRQGEALALRWRDVNLAAGQLRVRYALQRVKPRSTSNSVNSVNGVTRKYQLHLVEPKNRKARRTVQLPAVTLAALVAHRTKQATERLLAGSRWTPPTVHCEGKSTLVDDFIFTTSIGTPFEGCNVSKHFHETMEALGIPRRRFHDLRHTAATLLAVQGVHPKTIQSVLGWDQAVMVDRYTHFVDEMRRDAATKMDAVLNPVAVSLAVKDPKQRAS